MIDCMINHKVLCNYKNPYKIAKYCYLNNLNKCGLMHHEILATTPVYLCTASPHLSLATKPLVLVKAVLAKGHW